MNSKELYKVGDEVTAKLRPEEVLVIIRYVDGLYYCAMKSKLVKEELAFFELELVMDYSLKNEDSGSDDRQ